MPEPAADPNLRQTKRVARRAIIAGLIITLLKFAAFAITGSMSVLSDALESIVNIFAAAVMLQALRLASEPPDEEHPYGHGNAEFMAVTIEGLLILIAAISIAGSAAYRWFHGVAPERLDLGLILVTLITLLTAGLAAYVWNCGRRYENATLIADGKHLATDVLTTAGVLLGLLLVRLTGQAWIDHVVALSLAGFVGWAGWKLLREGFDGLMGRADPDDDRVILDILDQRVKQGDIGGYHKVRHRHTGPFHWVDMHLEIDGRDTIADGHALASDIEGEIERALGQANATAHIEPMPADPAPSAAPKP